MTTITVLYADIRYTATKDGESLRYLSELKAMSFPTIRKWTIHGTYEFLASLDLSSADTLDFWSSDRLTNRLINPIPHQLTTLALCHVLFTPESLPGGQRYSLPFLTSLTISNVIFFGPMRKYFLCPNLNHLEYDIASSELSADEIAVKVHGNPYRAPIREALDQAFFQENSALKSISLKGTKIDGVLVPILEPCPALRHLEIKDCRIETFFQPFLKKLQDPKYLPTLQTIYIDNSWSIQFDTSFNEFVIQCGYIRRELDVSGSGTRDRRPIYNSDQSRSDSESDNDTNSDDSDDFDDEDSDLGYEA
jgi:hypothetical protein